MRTTLYLIALLVMFITSAAVGQQPVKVEQGLLEGTSEDGLTVYKHIPFAAPPIGDLRWRGLQPAAKWNGVREADKFAPAPLKGRNPPSGKSEDCFQLCHMHNPTVVEIKSLYIRPIK